VLASHSPKPNSSKVPRASECLILDRAKYK
jgi:hypothetical protein